MLISAGTAACHEAGTLRVHLGSSATYAHEVQGPQPSEQLTLAAGTSLSPKTNYMGSFFIRKK